MVDLVMTQTHMHFTYNADARMADQLTYSSPGEMTSRVLLTNLLSTRRRPVDTCAWLTEPTDARLLERHIYDMVD